MSEEEELVQEILNSTGKGLSKEIKNKHLEAIRRYLFHKSQTPDNHNHHLALEQRPDELIVYMTTRVQRPDPMAIVGISEHNDKNEYPEGVQSVMQIKGQFPQVFASLNAISQDTNAAWDTAKKKWSDAYPSVANIPTLQISPAPKPIPLWNNVPVKYVFMDIVKFTDPNRSEEAQAAIIDGLNKTVLAVLSYLGVQYNERILLPTGDGMCIGLLKGEYDIHIDLACRLIVAADAWSKAPNIPEDFKYGIRVGVHEGNDLKVTDINGKDNLCGAAINDTQRIMSQGDLQQIIVSNSVFGSLKAKAKYINQFRAYTARNKHDEEIQVYQLIDKSRIGLNIDEPNSFLSSQPLTSQCSKCGIDTKHRLLLTKVHKYEVEINQPDELVKHEDTYFMLECSNCSALNLRIVKWHDRMDDPDQLIIKCYPPIEK